jgi:5-methylcytosine-specific restriction enzyme A
MGMLKGRSLPPRLAPMPATLKVPPKQVEAFYQSSDWRSFIDQVKNERGWKCEACGAKGRGIRLIGDHIVERKDGGADFDRRNVQLLCLPCHNTKTARARTARAKGVAP